jgi:glutamine cyclotransferase
MTKSTKYTFSIYRIGYFWFMKWFFLMVTLITFMACNNDDSNGDETASAPVISHSITASYPHDTSSFTQGLTFYNGELLEGTGMEGKSKLMAIDLNTGRAKNEISLDSALFGEGITVLNDTLYQLTWKNRIVLVYSAKDFKKIKEYPLNTEGWGITNDGTNLIVSDGSSNLYFYEPSTFRLLRTQGVTEMGNLSINLNELEFINGYVYANQYEYPYILKIDPNSGQVVSKLDLSEVVQRVKAKMPQADVLNGIAFNPQTNKIYITGKYWPELYEIQFEH